MARNLDCFLCSNMVDRGGYVDLTNDFRVAADIAPINRDHCLFFTAKHVISFSELDAQTLAAAEDTLRAIAALPLFSGREVLFYEHGPSEARTNVVGCCDHAHVHILPMLDAPTDGSTSAIDRMALLSGEERAGKIAFVRKLQMEELSSLRTREYFWIADSLKSLETFAIVQPERQYLRRLAALLLGKSAYQTWDLYDDGAAKRTTERLRLELAIGV